MPKPPWCLTLRQFIHKAVSEFGGEVSSLVVLLGTYGETDLKVIRIETPEAAVTYFAALLDIDPDEELAPTVLRSLCVQLGVKQDLFGLELAED